MDKAAENNENVKEPAGLQAETGAGKATPNFLGAILDGTFLSREIIIRQFPYIIFITVLCALYIANRYSTEKIVRETQALQNELKELRAEQISVTSELMQLSQQSEVMKLICKYNIGLSEAPEPPIIVEKEEVND